MERKTEEEINRERQNDMKIGGMKRREVRDKNLWRCRTKI